MNFDELTDVDDDTEEVLEESDEDIDVDVEIPRESDPLKTRRNLEDYFEQKRLREELDYLLDDKDNKK